MGGTGQFGTRLQGGKDAASARYIHTLLEKTTRKVFHEADDKLLAYLSDDGQSIEPQWCALHTSDFPWQKAGKQAKTKSQNQKATSK